MKRTPFVTVARIELAREFLKQWEGLEPGRRCAAPEWLALKFSCSRMDAAKLYDAAAKTK